MNLQFDDAEPFASYHTGTGPARKASRQMPLERRPFIAWDGEGANLKGDNAPQHYVLFGASTGDYIADTQRGLAFGRLAELILKVGRENPDAWHVGYFFDYDANMILRTLSDKTLRVFYYNGRHVKTRLMDFDSARYGVTYRRGKWLRITKYLEGYDRETNPHATESVTIYDIGSFYACSFVKAVRENLLPSHPEIADTLAIVEEGKTHRGSEQFNDAAYVERYWLAEIRLMQMLADDLRKRVYGAGFRVRQWYGPGVLANASMRQHGIKAHMEPAPDVVREASRYAYAGGRFELFKVGRIQGPIYSVDINSAYPYAISQLPSLANGEWRYVSKPTRLARFGVYHVRLKTRMAFAKIPGPLFHRDEYHNISFPWVTEGWYWSPEVSHVMNTGGVDIVEGWEWHATTNERPFDYIRDMYEKRREWKAQGIPAQLALKLCMNSMYGKMAQRVGYDSKNGRIPQWHQLEWAGWVTSYTRAMLYRVMRGLPKGSVIAVETDGIYTTANPASLNLRIGGGLGEWESDTYDEMLYIQSGLAWLRKGDKWTPKRRGLDADSFTLTDAQNYVRSLSAGGEWSPFVGTTNRFIGLGAALNSNAPLKTMHCRWLRSEREIYVGERGKRQHVAAACDACKAGENAYDMPHDLVIVSRAYDPAQMLSTPHSIPWEGNDTGDVAEWRDYQDVTEELIINV